MRRPETTPWSGAGGLFALALALVTVASLLRPQAVAAQGEADFLFDRPDASLAIYGGWFVPSAGSDIFDTTTETLTVESRDFQSPLIRGELAFRATERLDVSLSAGYTRSETTGEYQEYVGVDDLPILQTTTLSTVPLTVNVKAYLLDRGRSISRFAWIPAAWSPWIGAGVGVVRYRWLQEGEFVDEQSDGEFFDIFLDRLEAEGTEPLFHVATGAEVTLTPRLVLAGDVRYQWASGEMGGDYGDFEIDLGGFQASAGLSVRF